MANWRRFVAATAMAGQFALSLGLLAPRGAWAQAAPAVKPTPTVQPSSTVQGAHVEGSGMHAAGATTGDGDSKAQITDCHCKSISGAKCTQLPWQDCMMAPLTTIGIAASLGLMAYSMFGKTASDGAGGESFPSTTFDPTKPFAAQVGCTTGVCDCTQTANKSNILCNPDELQNLGKDLGAVKTALDLNTDLPPGMTAEDVKANLARAESLSAQLASGTIPSSAELGIKASDFAGDPDVDGTGRGSGGKAYNVIEGGTSGGGLGADFGATKSIAGPGDRTGLGATLWNGLLDMLDDKSGRSLTLWQRATRRYQGAEGKRAYALARIEGLRNQQFQTKQKAKAAAKPALAVATVPAAAQKSGPARAAKKPVAHSPAKNPRKPATSRGAVQRKVPPLGQTP